MFKHIHIRLCLNINIYSLNKYYMTFLSLEFSTSKLAQQKFVTGFSTFSSSYKFRIIAVKFYREKGLWGIISNSSSNAWAASTVCGNLPDLITICKFVMYTYLTKQLVKLWVEHKVRCYIFDNYGNKFLTHLVILRHG